MQIFRFKTKSKEWHKARCKVITGTDVASLFGLHKYQSLPKLVEKKLNCGAGREDEVKDNSILRTGRMMEQVAIQSALELGIDIEPAAPSGNVEFIIDDEEILGASLDAITYCSREGRTIVECKSTENTDKYNEWRKGNIPEQYLLQIQVQLGVSHLGNGYFIGVESKPPFATTIFKIKANKKIYSIVESTVKDFWDKFNTDPKQKFTTNKDGKKQILELLPSTIKKLNESWNINDIFVDNKEKPCNNIDIWRE